MKRLRRLPAVILAVFALAAGVSARAADSAPDKAELYLKRLNVLGIMSETQDLTKTLTRGEMAKIICGVGGYNITGTDEKIFSDVPRDYVYADYINTAYSFGIINGTGNGMFSPDEEVTREQMYKMLLCTAGYQMLANERGGYPTGYVALAGANDIMMPGASGAVTVLEAAYSTFKALDMPVVRVAPDKSVSIGAGDDTLLNKLLAADDIEISDGVLTFDGYTSLLGAEEPNRYLAAVDGVSMRNDGAALNGLIGRYVEYFTREGEMTAAYEYPGKNDTVKFTADKIDSMSETASYSVYADGARTTTYRLEDAPYVAYNRQGLSGYSQSDMLPEYGDVTLIDNDDNGRYDVVMVNDIKYYVVDKASASGLSVQYKRYEGQSESGYRIDEGDLDINVFYSVTDGEGNELSPSAVTKNAVIGVIKSPDGNMISVIVTKSMFDGILTSIGEDELTVNDETYEIARGRKGGAVRFDVSAGDSVSVYLNENKQVVYCEKQSGTNGNYAYVERVYPDDSGDEWYVRLVMSGSLGSLENRKYYWVKDKLAYNDKITDFAVGSKTRVNGERQTDELIKSIEHKVVQLKFNSSGDLTAIDELEAEFEYTNGKYNHNTGAMVQNNIEDITELDYDNPAVLLVGNINTLVIPKAANENYSRDEYLARYRIENDSAIYNIAFYDIPEGSQTPRLIVLKEALTDSGTAQDDASVGIVTTGLGTVSEDGETLYTVKIYTADGSERDVIIRDDARVTDSSIKTSVSQIEKGDVVEFSWDSQGYANTVHVIASAANPIDRMQMGVVEKTQSNVIWNKSNGEEFYNLFYYINKDGERVEAGVKSSYPIFRYESGNIDVIEMSDVNSDPDGVDGDTVIIAGSIAVILPR